MARLRRAFDLLGSFCIFLVLAIDLGRVGYPAGGEAVSQLYRFSLKKSIFDVGHVIMACVGMIERDF